MSLLLYKRYYFLFIIGGIGYALIEILARGYTHPSMAIAGGLSLISIDFINSRFYHKSILLRGFLSSLAITGIELFIGIWVNLILHLGVWNYSKEAFNFMGQICPLYSLIWFGISLVVIWGIEKLSLSRKKA